VTGAIRWQEPRTVIGARFVAAFTALWLIAGGLLGARHEAEVPHVRDNAGRVFHGTPATGENGNETRIHDRASALHDHRACPLSASLHQPGCTSHAQLASVVAVVATELDAPPARCGRRTRHVYRLAPKTSPPFA
jgi:hypothetical protein